MSEPAGIGVIGGSGFYEFFDSPDDGPEDSPKESPKDAALTELVEIDTPFGAPSAPITIGLVAGRRVAFLPRHGVHHQFAPHRVNYRANLWALRAVGVRQVLAPCAVGSLRSELGPGSLVIPDQVVDRTWGRAHTVYDAPGPVVHVSFADPYCPRGRRAVTAQAAHAGWDAAAGTLVVINGPRFSSRAESRWHAAAGWAVVGMTGQPEASIARELALCYTSIALVTDHDAGVEAGGGVTHAEVLEVFAHNMARLKALVRRTIGALPADTDTGEGADAAIDTAACDCRHALDGLKLPFDLP